MDSVAQCGRMNRHHITLSEPVSRALQAQVKSGRYKDFSAAIQDAAWHYFIRTAFVFEEYGVNEAKWTKAATRDLAGIRLARKAGN